MSAVFEGTDLQFVVFGAGDHYGISAGIGSLSESKVIIKIPIPDIHGGMYRKCAKLIYPGADDSV
jgi:hypothetical protein